MDEQRDLRFVSFVAHATRGVIREKKIRRAAMLVTLMMALVLLVLGATVLEPFLSPREHLLRFVLFWGACAWLTIAALLLALFDLLVVRAAIRAERRALQKGLQTGGSPISNRRE